jgi:hypothetical protein
MFRKRLAQIVIALIIILASNVRGELATEEEMEKVCKNWLLLFVKYKGSWAGSGNPGIIDSNDIFGDNGLLLARCFYIAPSGYVVVPVLKELPPVKVYSEIYTLNLDEGGGVSQLLREVLENRLEMFILQYGNLNSSQPVNKKVLLGRNHRREWDRFTRQADSFISNLEIEDSAEILDAGPLISTNWTQRNPYNKLCPMGDGGQCVVGCSATAVAQIMKYHEWPPVGRGLSRYNWSGDQSCGGDYSGGLLSASYFDQYDWSNMPDNVDNGVTSAIRGALAELCYEVGVAMEMDYGKCGSAAYLGSAASALATYFRYDPSITREDRHQYSAVEWFNLIQSEINSGRPMLYSIYSHALVCDGWRTVTGLNQYHFNFGWGGPHTGWYTVDNIYCNWSGCDPMVENIYRNIKIQEHGQILLAIAQNAYAGADIKIQASIQEGLWPISAVNLYYTIDGDPVQNLAAVSEGNGVWIATLGKYQGGTEIVWRLVAVDEQSNEMLWPQDGAGLKFTVSKPSLITAWGDDYAGACDVPEPNTKFIAVTGGKAFSLGLRSDGTIVAWGDNTYGQCNVPEPNANFVAVAGRVSHCLGLKSDGTIVAWGDNTCFQCNVPEPNTNFVAVSCGMNHSLGLRRDGAIVAWGRCDAGRCNVPYPNMDFVAVAVGLHHSIGLKNNGEIVAWGWSRDGRCDIPEPNANYIAIRAGNHHNLALKNDGTIVAWGANTDGQCNVPEPNANFVAISAGDNHSLGLKSDSTVVAWGSNSEGQCEVPSPNESFITVAAGGSHSMGLKLNILDLEQPLVDVTYPNGGEYFETGDTVHVSWIASDNDDIDSVSIWISENGGEDFTCLFSNEPNDSLCEWIVPAADEDSCLIRIVAYDPSMNMGQDTSDGFFALKDPTAIGEEEEEEIDTPSYIASLEQNYPNPFNGVTNIVYTVAARCRVNLAIYDTAGRFVRVLEKGRSREPGRYVISWDGRDNASRPVTSGIYYVRIKAGKFRQARKMVYLR